MITRINGKDIELEGPTPLLDYLATLGVDPRAVAIELNGQILQRDELTATVLREGDVLEIVRMVGGGSGARRAPWAAGLSVSTESPAGP